MKYLEVFSYMEREKMFFGLRVTELITQELPPQPGETLEQAMLRIKKASKILEAKGILSMEYTGNGRMNFRVLNPDYFPKITVH